ncbi:MAG: ribose-phosphate pyrophosphokinase [Lachnospiraceae bacterium]|jgi:ribose-phosphate pyrophosphokinase|nr:ribose-phosphate pyrophosphokinase [Lachnospiraceae bacterium]MCX4306463.1 ribose-phosphate pyrophosphokinase [Acetatifactor sp.]
MPNLRELENAMPVAPLKLIALPSAEKMARRINNHLVEFRKSIHNDKVKNDPAFQGYSEKDYLVPVAAPRFGTGEAKAIFSESIRGKDLFLLVDVCNHSITYKMNGYVNHMSPDDHYQDLKRVIAACNGKAHRINVIMPFLYEGRQHKRNGRESLDCAYALRELSAMGISNFITFDAHDPRVQNAIPLSDFDNFTTPYNFIKALLNAEDDLIVDKDHLIVISPDEGALDRAIYFATVLGVDTGMFYKRRDYSTIVGGKNPIVAHEFLGDNIDGKDIVIIDDMISSGGSMIDTAKQLKKMNARRVFICCTFGLFTDGLKAFDEAYEQGYFDKVVTTDLTWLPPEIYTRPYFIEADMSKFIASLIDFMNHDVSLANTMAPTEKIHGVLDAYNSRRNVEINMD